MFFEQFNPIFDNNHANDEGRETKSTNGKLALVAMARVQVFLVIQSILCDKTTGGFVPGDAIKNDCTVRKEGSVNSWLEFFSRSVYLHFLFKYKYCCYSPRCPSAQEAYESFLNQSRLLQLTPFWKSVHWWTY